jgi:hypothetical protein
MIKGRGQRKKGRGANRTSLQRVTPDERVFRALRAMQHGASAYDDWFVSQKTDSSH